MEAFFSASKMAKVPMPKDGSFDEHNPNSGVSFDFSQCPSIESDAENIDESACSSRHSPTRESFPNPRNIFQHCLGKNPSKRYNLFGSKLVTKLETITEVENEVTRSQTRESNLLSIPEEFLSGETLVSKESSMASSLSKESSMDDGIDHPHHPTTPKSISGEDLTVERHFAYGRPRVSTMFTTSVLVGTFAFFGYSLGQLKAESRPSAQNIANLLAGADFTECDASCEAKRDAFAFADTFNEMFNAYFETLTDTFTETFTQSSNFGSDSQSKSSSNRGKSSKSDSFAEDSDEDGYNFKKQSPKEACESRGACDIKQFKDFQHTRLGRINRADTFYTSLQQLISPNPMFMLNRREDQKIIINITSAAGQKHCVSTDGCFCGDNSGMCLTDCMGVTFEEPAQGLSLAQLTEYRQWKYVFNFQNQFI